MNLDKISLTLYDLLGYLLPGYIVVMALAIVEATFLGSTLLTLEGIKSNPVPFSILAYFLGQFCHATGNILKEKLRPHVRTKREQLNNPSTSARRKRWSNWWLGLVAPSGSPIDKNLDAEVERELCTAFKLTSAQLEDNRDLNTYLLADSFLLAAGLPGEREIFQAREGFFKAATVAFLSLCVLFLISALFGGVTINRATHDAVHINRWQTLLCAAGIMTFAAISWTRCAFFSCLKRTHVKLLFLAVRRTK